MIALLSALLGFFTSAFPEGIKLFREGRDRTHELAIMRLQMEHEERARQYQREAGIAEQAVRLQEIAVTERQALNAGAGTAAGAMGIAWVDALSGSVRPMITYSFFLLYALVKAAQFQLLLATGTGGAAALVALWSEEDMGLFAAVIAFWFGSRAVGKLRRG